MIHDSFWGVRSPIFRGFHSLDSLQGGQVTQKFSCEFWEKWFLRCFKRLLSARLPKMWCKSSLVLHFFGWLCFGWLILWHFGVLTKQDYKPCKIYPRNNQLTSQPHFVDKVPRKKHYTFHLPQSPPGSFLFLVGNPNLNLFLPRLHPGWEDPNYIKSTSHPSWTNPELLSFWSGIKICPTIFIQHVYNPWGSHIVILFKEKPLF